MIDATRALDSRPLAAGICCTKLFTRLTLSIRTVPLASRGTIDVTFTTPAFYFYALRDNRANKTAAIATQSAVSALTASPSFCLRLNCERDSIQARFLSCASQKKVAKNAQIMSAWAAKVSSVG